MPFGLQTLQNFGFVWSRMFRREVIERYHILFDERIQYCEDNAFLFDFNCILRTFCQENAVTYNYRINRSGSLTTKLIHPRIKFHLYEHMERFIDGMNEQHIVSGLRNNVSFSQAMWNGLSTAVINEILDNRFREANKRRKSPVMKEIVNSYKPRTKKDKIFIKIYNKSFLCLIVCVKMYYGNFAAFRRSKFFSSLSRGE